MMRRQQKEEELRDRVRCHKIHWHAGPEYHICGSERQQVGFRLVLLGSNDTPSTRPISGCPESWKVYMSLHELACWVLPAPAEGEDDLQVGIDEASLVDQGDRRDIMMTIKIAHRHGSDLPVDEQEAQCLAAMEKRLLELGAPEDEPV
jgi:hypothetical protein